MDGRDDESSSVQRRAWLAARRRTVDLQLEACSPRASRHHVERIAALRSLRRRLEDELRAAPGLRA